MGIGSVVGCKRQDEITRYSITVPDGPSNVQPAAPGHGGSATSGAASTRMLAAIVPKGKQTWFFKLVGPDKPVDKQQDQFAALIDSLQFPDETATPGWDLPSGWRQRGASGMRFATIEIEEGERTLELTVIPLATRGELDQYVLANVNRWRNQLGLAPLAAIKPEDGVDGANSIREFELSDGTSVTMVNLIGRSGGNRDSGSKFDMANHPPIGGSHLGAIAAAAANSIELTYETPEGWSAGKAGGMRQAAFQVVDGKRTAEITVISLPQSGGERLPNVNRWRKQVKLDDTTAEQLAKDLQEIPLGTVTGDYVELAGPADAKPRESILAVMADMAGSTWFFKLKGDADLAERERERFQAFVRSVKFSSKEKTKALNDAPTTTNESQSQ